MKRYTANIEKETLENDNFRKVLFTGEKSQLVVMSLLPGEEIGNEVHSSIDQFIRIEEGEAEALIDNEEKIALHDDEVIIIPAGTWHNITNVSTDKKLKLYTIYSPAEHPDGTIDKTKEDALKREEEEGHSH